MSNLDILVTAGTGLMVGYGVRAVIYHWTRRPKITWDPERMAWRSARAVLRDRQWHP